MKPENRLQQRRVLWWKAVLEFGLYPLCAAACEDTYSRRAATRQVWRGWESQRWRLGIASAVEVVWGNLSIHKHPYFLVLRTFCCSQSNSRCSPGFFCFSLNLIFLSCSELNHVCSHIFTLWIPQESIKCPLVLPLDFELNPVKYSLVLPWILH